MNCSKKCREGNEREYHRGTEKSKEKQMIYQAKDGRGVRETKGQISRSWETAS